MPVFRWPCKSCLLFSRKHSFLLFRVGAILESIFGVLQDLHNKFWIKVHKAGDIPVMQVYHPAFSNANRSLTKYSSDFKLQEDKSSWTKIDVTTNKMLTKYITIKGEDVFASKPYKDLKVCVGRTYNFSF